MKVMIVKELMTGDVSPVAMFESTAAKNLDFECANPTSLISNPVFSILFDGPVCAGETVCTVFMSPVPIGPPKTAR